MTLARADPRRARGPDIAVHPADGRPARPLRRVQQPGAGPAGRARRGLPGARRDRAADPAVLVGRAAARRRRDRAADRRDLRRLLRRALRARRSRASCSGGSMVFDVPEVSDLRVSFWSVLVPAVAGDRRPSAAIVVFAVGRSCGRGRVAGVGELLGIDRSSRRRALAPEGTVFVRGEYWTARRTSRSRAGERVEVDGGRRPAPAGATGRTPERAGCATSRGGAS